jgi:hypothetical protein
MGRADRIEGRRAASRALPHAIEYRPGYSERSTGSLPDGWTATATGASYDHPVTDVLFAFPLVRA